MKVNRVALEQMSRRRGAAFLAAAQAAGTVDGANLEIEETAWSALIARHPAAPFAVKKGLGDWVASVATPIARVLKLPCIDPATQQLRPESTCAQRKAALNRVRLP